VSDLAVKRGHVYRVVLGQGSAVLGLILSNDRHNAEYDEYVTAQVAASREHEGTGGSVRLKSGDPAFGYVICRDIGMVHREELKEDVGPLSMETMIEVERTLKQVLGL
jgi:mRNA-degrading endonuclease toxin of MazEF toxin-antitoxin module